MLFNEGYMHKRLKIRSLILVALIVASFFTITFLPATTLAVDSKKSPNENARALAYFYTLRRCMTETFRVSAQLTDEQINNFGWLNGHRLPLGAQFITNDGDWDGNVNCDGGGTHGNWRQDAVKALGYANNRDLLCNVMNPYQSVSPELDGERSAVETLYKECSSGQGSLDVQSLVNAKKASTSLGSLTTMFNQSVGQQFFADTEPISSKDVEIPLQELFYTTFEKFCQPTSYNGGTIGSDLRKESIKKFDSDLKTYKPVDVLVKADRINKTTDVIAHNVLPSGEPNKTLESSTMSCRQIIDKTNSYADKAQAVYDALPREVRDGMAQTINTPPPGGRDDGDGSKTSCAVEGVGWIVCPVSNFLAGITDGLFNVLTLLLLTSPMGTDNPTYKAWEVMRNIANVLFVIAFLIIIFSQITNVGVTNYGIKKLLPRIIVAAILVNVSYFICAIAVDLSNIIGKSLQDLLSNLSGAVSGSSTTGNNLNVWGDITAWVLAGGATGLAVTGAVLSIGAAGGILPALALLLPLLVTTLFAVLTVILVLAARQALIIILIAVAPLAFVAYLLPNTEDWFTKWRKLFMTMLLLFPIISFIFGGSQLAATIIRNGTDNPLIYLLSLAVQVVPFFLVPIIMKFSGGLLNRFGGIVNNPNKGPFDRLKKSAQGFGERQRNAGRARQLQRYAETGRGGAVTRWQLRRKAEQSGVENVLKRAEAGYVAEQIKTDEAFRNVVAGGNAFNAASQGAKQTALAGAVSALDKIKGEEVSAAKILIEDARLDSAQRQTLATTGSIEVDGKVYTGAAMQKAAIEEQMVKGSYNEKMAIIENSGTDRLKAFSQTIASGARAMAAQNPGLGGKTLGLIEDGKITNGQDIRNAMFSALQEGKFTAASIADMHDNARDLLISVAAESTDPTHHAALKSAVEKIYSTPELSAKVTGNETAVSQLEQLRDSGQIAGQGTFDIPRS
jgi:hypothetical protein